MLDMRARLQRGTLWIGASQVLTNLLGLISTLVLARLLTPADFGLVALASTMLAIIGSVTELSLSSALIQHKNPSDVHFHTAWTLGLARSLAVAAAFSLAAWPAALIYREPRLVMVMLALAGSMVIGGLGNPRALMLTRDLVFWQQFAMQASQKLAGFIAALAIALIYHSYWALIAGSVASQAAAAVVSYAVVPFRPRIGFRHAGELLSFSIWLIFAQMINTINWNFDQLLIGSFLGRGALGLYTVGNNLAVMPTREAIAPLSQTLFPAFARLHGEPARLAAAYQSAQALMTAAALPLGVGFALTADPIVRLAMGPKWLPAVQVIQVLASMFALHTLGNLSQPLAMAAGETRLLFWRDLQAFVFRIPFIIGGMYFFGLAGIIYARVLSGSFIILLNTNVVKRITGLSVPTQLRVNQRSILSVAAMAAAVLIVNHCIGDPVSSSGLVVKIALLVASGAVIYPSVTCVLWMAAGRPEGPETEIMKMVGRILGRATTGRSPVGPDH